MENRELFKVAEQALEKAYAPYSNFKVSAALLTDDRRIFTGVNVENASYGCTICAERTACVKAVSEKEQYQCVEFAGNSFLNFPLIWRLSQELMLKICKA